VSGAAKFSAHRSAPFMGLPLTAPLRSRAGFKGGEARAPCSQSPPTDNLPQNRFLIPINFTIVFTLISR